MHNIVTNQSGTRTISVTDRHLKTIEHYHLLDHLVDSNGIVDETVLDKLKLTVRSLLANSSPTDKGLLDLCFDVIYHNNMKALGLSRLITLYETWHREQPAEEHDGAPAE